MLRSGGKGRRDSDPMGCGGGGCRPLSCTMDVLSLLKHSITSDDTNPITKYFSIGKQVGSAGPEMVWKIYDAVRTDDKREASVFVFEKKIADKLHKPRRREVVSEMLRKEVQNLERFRHTKILSVMHCVEECHDSLAFATEPVFASLANVLGNYDRLPAAVPPELKDHGFIELEIRSGVMQVTEGLSYLHTSEQIIHRNVCPESIIINKRGCWKLAGMSFLERVGDVRESVSCHPWSSKVSKMAQPNLNYIAPEIQLNRSGCTLSDMFSLGMTVCTIYNGGRALISADHSPQQYVKQLDMMHDEFGVVAHKMPMALVDPVEKMINKDIRYRPSAQAFSLIKYFSDPVVYTLQYLDGIERKDPSEKIEAYTSLSQVIPNIPRKVLYKNVFPVVCQECRSSESIVYALPALLTMIDFAPRDDYLDIILPEFKVILSSIKPVQATVYILSKLDIILSKTPLEDIRADVLPLVFNTLDSSSLQAQEAALGAISVIKEYLNDSIMRKMVLPRAKSLFYRSTCVKLRINALSCIDHLLDSLDKMLILDEVLPFLTDITCQDADVVMNVVSIYKHMLSDKKFGLTHNLIATKVMPSLIPHTVNPGLNMEQFSALMEVLREMLEQIDRQRRNKMKQETVSLHVPIRGSAKEGEDNSSQNLLMVDDRCHKLNMAKVAPSTPELHQRPKMSPKAQRRNHSLQSLGMSLEEKSTLDRPLDTIRRHSLVPPNTSSTHPTISITSDDPHSPGSRRSSAHSLGPFSVSGIGEYYRSLDRQRRPSTHSLGVLPISMFGDTVERPRRPSTHSLGVFPLGCFSDDRDKYDRPRRPSTHSLGPMVVPDTDRRGSRGSIFGTLGIGDAAAASLAQRRPSFQAFGESVMQFLSGK